jgi:hypothetical protein
MKTKICPMVNNTCIKDSCVFWIIVGNYYVEQVLSGEDCKAEHSWGCGLVKH